MAMIFPIEEAGGSLFNKKEVLRWYEEQHKDLIPFRELKRSTVYKTSSGYSKEKIKTKMTLKDAILPMEYLKDEAYTCYGYEYRGKLIYVLELHSSSSTTVNIALGPGSSEYRYVSTSPIGKKYEGYYLNCEGPFLAKPERKSKEVFKRTE